VSSTSVKSARCRHPRICIDLTISRLVTGRAPVAQVYIQTYADGRLFSWDQQKSEVNLADRGFDFDFASVIFAGTKERIAYEAVIEAQDPKSRPRGP